LTGLSWKKNELQRPPAEAVQEACKQRFRPILLTTFTTTLGLIPLYLGGGVMWEPMAIAIMVGLLFATCITLLFVPVLYSVLYRVPK
jgi:multidrug efflux pump subunit AcrB